jgi:hypothetical protein
MRGQSMCALPERSSCGPPHRISVESAVESAAAFAVVAECVERGRVCDQCWSERREHATVSLVMNRSWVRFPQAAPTNPQVTGHVDGTPGLDRGLTSQALELWGVRSGAWRGAQKAGREQPWRALADRSGDAMILVGVLSRGAGEAQVRVHHTGQQYLFAFLYPTGVALLLIALLLLVSQLRRWRAMRRLFRREPRATGDTRSDA